MMKKKRIILLGANNPQVIRLIQDINSASETEFLDIVGWIDNDFKKMGQIFCGYEILGTPDVLIHKKYADTYLVNNITSNGIIRKETTQDLLKYPLPFVTLIHPNVNTRDVLIGEGCIIGENVILESKVEICDYVCIASGSIICHESFISDYVFISSGSRIAGLVKIKSAVTVFMGATILPRLTINTGAIISAGSVVDEDVEKFISVAGNPARKVSLTPTTSATTKITTSTATNEERVLLFLKDKFPKLLSIKKDEYFVDYDLLESFEVMRLITQLETHFNIHILDDEINEENVGSFNQLYTFIESKL